MINHIFFVYYYMSYNKLIHIFFILFFFCLAQPAISDDSKIEKQFDTNDGPHLFWKNDQQVEVFYFCDRQIISKSFDFADSLKFNGFCRDSLVEYFIGGRSHKPEASRFEKVSKIFAISDIHGDYEHFIEILINAHVVDSNLNWTFGDGHMVICGDVFDRGDKVTECLWLIYKLEQQAKKSGGAVHYLLGNHELMVIRGDLRYVSEKYIKGISKRKRFKYEELFGAEMELGRWLRSKNVAVVANNILFVHGGISLEMVELGYSVEMINNICRSGLDFSSARLSFDTRLKTLYGSLGPFWYRGYHYEMEDMYPQATSGEIDSILAFFEINHIVVGHTQKDSISSLYDGKVLAIDVIVEDIGSQQALFWQSGKFYRVCGDGKQTLISTK